MDFHTMVASWFAFQDVGESVNKGSKKVLATYCIDLKSYATIVPSQFSCELDFQPVSAIVKRVTLNFTLSCVFLRRGKATYVFLFMFIF